MRSGRSSLRCNRQAVPLNLVSDISLRLMVSKSGFGSWVSLRAASVIPVGWWLLVVSVDERDGLRVSARCLLGSEQKVIGYYVRTRRSGGVLRLGR